MRHRRAQYQQLNQSNKQEECSWNSVIVWTICVSVVVLIILYLAFGPNIYHAPPVLVGPETVSLLTEDKKQIQVFEHTVNINGNDIFYRYTEPRGAGRHVQPDVLLLHGAKYGSQTWKGLGTLQIFSFWGYRTFAVDLPGYKLSKKATAPTKTTDNSGYIEFMNQLARKLSLSKVVLIVPSMSGIYGLPLLLQESEVDIIGFIAIAPQGTNKFTKSDYQKVDIPTLIMYGERDRTQYKDESVFWLENIPNVQTVMIPKGEHAAFVGNPEDFHKEILRFLSSECKIGEDEYYGFDTDTSLNDIYEDDNDNYYFQGYNRYNYDDDTTTDEYYGDVYNGNYEEYLEKYFGDTENDYYMDDTDLYFDNINGDTSDTITDYEDDTY